MPRKNKVRVKRGRVRRVRGTVAGAAPALVPAPVPPVATTAPPLAVAPAAAPVSTPAAMGDAIVVLARRHIGEEYVLGARAPMANAAWMGPWDCAEFASWCVYHATGILYGVQPAHNPVMADAYTGFWADQAERDAATIPIEDAVRVAGACLLRKPGSGPIGHIAISTGDGGTIEAHSSDKGVIAGKATGRRWDCGVLVPGVSYFFGEKPVALKPPRSVIRVTTPLTRGRTVEKIQQRLSELGYSPGTADGVFGPQTARAVMEFQADNGLVADGEVGNATLAKLKVADA